MRIRNFIFSVSSILLCLGYLAAIVGIDIHIDHHDGKVYVVSLLAGTDCESLHPDDHCNCLVHHQGKCHAQDEDCENEISVVSLTGDGSTLVYRLAPSCLLLHLLQTTLVFSVPEFRYGSYSIFNPPRVNPFIFRVLRI